MKGTREPQRRDDVGIRRPRVRRRDHRIGEDPLGRELDRSTARCACAAVKVAVLAPALVSEGKVEARGAYSMSGADPATLFESARIQGEFKIDKGVLGSFDLTRALQTGGAQTSGRTIFSELTGQAVYDKGAVKIRNVAIAAGAMNAGASLDIDADGGLSGRVVADVKTPNQTLRATLNLSGKIQDPVIRK